MAELTKLSVARAQLVTALDLFVRDKDPVAVHCLACGGGEIIEGIAEEKNEQPFVLHILKVQPDMDRVSVRAARNLYWNAFKHFSKQNGVARDDGELLNRFDDRANDAALYIGWWDYLLVSRTLPVAAQVFQVWWYAVHPEKVAHDADLRASRDAFPDIGSANRTEQKRRLRRKIEHYRKDKRLLADPATEQ